MLMSVVAVVVVVLVLFQRTDNDNRRGFCRPIDTVEVLDVFDCCFAGILGIRKMVINE